MVIVDKTSFGIIYRYWRQNCKNCFKKILILEFQEDSKYNIEIYMEISKN